MDYKFCPECGQKLPINAAFCTNCGTKQPSADDQHSNQTVENQNANSTAVQKEPTSVKAPQTVVNNNDSAQDEQQYRQTAQTQPSFSQSTYSQNARENTAHEKQPSTEKAQFDGQQQAQFFTPNAPEQRQRREQFRADADQQQFFNSEQNRQSNDYQRSSNNGQQFYQQRTTSAYNESAKPGLSTSFDVWLKCLSKSNACMGRADFWWGYLAWALIDLLLACCWGVAYVYLPTLNIIFGIIWIVFVVIFNVYYAFAVVERLHDAGHSGWNYLWNFTGILALYLFYLLAQPTNWNEQRWVRE